MFSFVEAVLNDCHRKVKWVNYFWGVYMGKLDYCQ